MKAVLRDRDGRVEAVCHSLEFLVRRIGSRPVERVDVWPGFDADHCQAGITLAEGGSTIFDLPVKPNLFCWVINRWARPNGWPSPVVHIPPTPAQPERRQEPQS
jgi:hypothetical protein